MNGPYDDIIDLPHHVSSVYPQMTAQNHAAQFSPFAALTGYDAAIKETARLTDQRIELGQSEMDALDMKLNLLAERIDDHPEVTLTYYQSDEKKNVGAYVEVIGSIKKIDDTQRVIVLINGERIPIADILDVECVLFGGII